MNPVGKPQVELTVREIEDAGLREVLQTPGAPFGPWAVLGRLLKPGVPFVFREPLGQAREVKVALSGLFGRFVARAYLERYFGLSVFVSLGRRRIVLDAQRSIVVQRRKRGDLPDWVAAASPRGHLTVAEAKGSHDPSGPARALGRAWTQAGRVNIFSNGRRVSVKRIAIVTRWGMHTGGPHKPWISVHDPIDEGSPIEPDEMEAIFVGLFRHHAANMIARLGHAELATSLRELTSAGSAPDERRAVDRAHGLLAEASTESAAPSISPTGTNDLIGGIVTRAGPLSGITVSRHDQETLTRLDLRPVFIGIRREVVKALIDGDLLLLEQTLGWDTLAVSAPDRSDRAGGWIIPLGDEPES